MANVTIVVNKGPDAPDYNYNQPTVATAKDVNIAVPVVTGVTVVQNVANGNDIPDFQYSLFDCFTAPLTCLEACLPCTSAATVSKAMKRGGKLYAFGTEHYNVNLLLFLTFNMIVFILDVTYGAILPPSMYTIVQIMQAVSAIISIMLAILIVTFRQALRQKLRMSQGTYCADCLAVFCCLPCSLTQMAREVGVENGISFSEPEGFDSRVQMV